MRVQAGAAAGGMLLRATSQSQSPWKGEDDDYDYDDYDDDNFSDNDDDDDNDNDGDIADGVQDLCPLLVALVHLYLEDLSLEDTFTFSLKNTLKSPFKLKSGKTYCGGCRKKCSGEVKHLILILLVQYLYQYQYQYKYHYQYQYRYQDIL